MEKFNEVCKKTFEKLMNPEFELNATLGRIYDSNTGFWMDLGYDVEKNVHDWYVQYGEWCKNK